MRSQPRFCVSVISSVVTIAFTSPANAHVTYRDLDALPDLVTATFGGAAMADPCAGKSSGCQSSNAFTRYGWRKGTEPTLGDSHQLTTNAEFWKFHLAATARVTITFVQGEDGVDPAFSVYSGLLPDQAHDDTAIDPLNPFDENTFCAAASPRDTHAAPYTYLPHDGYRDTLAYSTLGGLDTDSCSPLNSYVGQFDAFASWSMANANGEWARITYVASVSATPFTGNDHGIHVDGTQSAVAGTGETLVLVLEAGDYVIAAGGEACNGSSGDCTLPRLYGTVSYSQQPLCTDLDDGDPCTQDRCNMDNGAITHAPLDDGAACGTDLVCSASACVAACTDGSTCAPAAPDACKIYATVCNATHTGGTCDPATDAPDGTSCGAGQICRSGACSQNASSGQNESGGCSAEGGAGTRSLMATILVVLASLAIRRRARAVRRGVRTS